MADATALQHVIDRGTVELWRRVPELVASRYKAAADIKRTISKVIKHLPVDDPGYGYVYWNPETKAVWAVLSDGDEQQTHQRWHNALKAVQGVRSVRTEAEYGPYSDPDWIRIKKASALSWLNKPYELAGLPTGGPSPMSNSIVSGLLGAGVGYGAGTLMENLAPEKYVGRGRLRKNLAMLGGLGGASLHIPQAFANAGINRRATGSPHWLRSIFMGNKHQEMHPEELTLRNHHYGEKTGHWNRMHAICNRLPAPPELFVKAAIFAGGFGSGEPLRAIPVDAFNQAIWNDVHQGQRSSRANPYGTRSAFGDNSGDFHTPPVHAAAATGLITGVQQMYGNTPVLSPRHFIRGLTNAGLDMATARVAGGVLGALGGLTPDAQQKLQDIGVWSGMIRGVTGSVLGLP